MLTRADISYHSFCGFFRYWHSRTLQRSQRRPWDFFCKINQWNQFATEDTKNQTNFRFILPSYISVKPKSYSLFFLRHSPKGSPSKRSRAKYSPFKGKKKKNLWHSDVNVTVHCESLSAFIARRVLWTAEPRSTNTKVHLNFTNSVSNFGQLEFLQQ